MSIYLPEGTTDKDIDDYMEDTPEDPGYEKPDDDYDPMDWDDSFDIY